MKTLRVDVWSDIACPWCYVGKRRLEAAIARFSHGGAVEVHWRAFELDPAAPRARSEDVSYAERLAKKYGTGVEAAATRLQHMTDLAAADGLAFHFDRIRPGNTFDAHRVLHLAANRGVQDAVKERFLRAYFTEGEPIGDASALVRLAAQAGLDGDDVRAVLAGDAYAREVRADEAEAHALGISGVPFFAIDGRYGVSGAQSAEVLAEVLERAWTTGVETAPTEGAVCGPEGCV
jgi:predicted DsbA family dithiol-disulfide isomerase